MVELPKLSAEGKEVARRHLVHLVVQGVRGYRDTVGRRVVTDTGCVPLPNNVTQHVDLVHAVAFRPSIVQDVAVTQPPSVGNAFV